MNKITTWLLAGAMATALVSCDELLKDTTNTNTTPRTNTNTNTNTTTSKLNFIPTQVKGNQIIKYKYYTVSYSAKYKNPEWVAYELTAKQRANSDVPRSGSFKSDPNAQGSATNSDFTNSGYDRGHLVPAEDMSFSEEAMGESFYTTNVSPQDPSFNRGIWKSLEDKVRDWATEYNRVYVIAGPILPGRMTSTTEKIGANSDVVVPKQFFKIVLDYDKPDQKAIAFIFDNAAATKPLKQMACSIDKVEQVTGLDFFPNLSASEQAQLEAGFDLNFWSW